MAELIKYDELFIFLFNLFFKFPTNNFCHKFVERIFLIILTYLNNQQLVEVLYSLFSWNLFFILYRNHADIFFLSSDSLVFG